MLLLLFFAHYKEYFDDGASVRNQLRFESVNFVISRLPYFLRICFVNTRHDNIFILRSIENGNPAILRQFAFDAPQIIVVLFLTFGRTETVIMHTHRIALAEYVTYDAALAGSIHALQNNQQTTARPFHAIGIHQPLISCDFRRTNRDEPFRIILVAIKTRSGIAVDFGNPRIVVESQQLTGRKRPYGTEQLACLGNIRKSFGNGTAVLPLLKSVLNLVQRLRNGRHLRILVFVWHDKPPCLSPDNKLCGD